MAVIGVFTIGNLTSFAQQSAQITIIQDTEGTCSETNDCFSPSVVIIVPGGIVTWINEDDSKHSIISGSPVKGPDGVFESGILQSGDSFSYTFEEEGEYSYFSVNDLRKKGLVIVNSNPENVIIPEEKPEIILDTSGKEMTKQEGGFSSDASIMVELSTSDPVPEEPMSLHLKFFDSETGNVPQNVNYDIVVTQNGSKVLSEMGVHDEDGRNSHETSSLDSFDLVDVEITILGFGLPGDEANWTGPKGGVITYADVPEFGTIAMMILAISVGSLILLFSKIKKITEMQLKH